MNVTANTGRRLAAEWEPQSFVQLTWPHAGTDWAPYLDQAYDCFLAIARAVAARSDLLVVTRDAASTEAQLRQAGVAMRADTGRGAVLFEAPTDDTWARDHAFITTVDDGRCVLHDFRFNGWGAKFAAGRDNAINGALWRGGVVCGADYEDDMDTVLEGGSIESDGRGTILTTSCCLFAPNRNGYTSKAEAEAMLCGRLGAERVLWLDHGSLAGDDTDGHIDTLARLCPDDTIVYVGCDDHTDGDFEGLAAMEGELQALRTADGAPYRLLRLPMAAPAYYDGERLPATYANFLIMNSAVLMPCYGDGERDAAAAEVLQRAFPDREIVGIDCRVLIRQHGSLHCVTMQYPEGVGLRTVTKQ